MAKQKITVGEKGPERILTLDELRKLRRPTKKAAGLGRPAIVAEPAKGQVSGPFSKGPAVWVVCQTCTKMFSTKEKPVRYGVRPRHAAKHLADHKMGRIKVPK